MRVRVQYKEMNVKGFICRASSVQPAAVSSYNFTPLHPGASDTEP